MAGDAAFFLGCVGIWRKHLSPVLFDKLSSVVDLSAVVTWEPSNFFTQRKLANVVLTWRPPNMPMSDRATSSPFLYEVYVSDTFVGRTTGNTFVVRKVDFQTHCVNRSQAIDDQAKQNEQHLNDDDAKRQSWDTDMDTEHDDKQQSSVKKSSAAAVNATSGKFCSIVEVRVVTATCFAAQPLKEAARANLEWPF
jgi:hypothetical protein